MLLSNKATSYRMQITVKLKTLTFFLTGIRMLTHSRCDQLSLMCVSLTLSCWDLRMEDTTRVLKKSVYSLNPSMSVVLQSKPQTYQAPRDLTHPPTMGWLMFCSAIGKKMQGLNERSHLNLVYDHIQIWSTITSRFGLRSHPDLVYDHI